MYKITNSIVNKKKKKYVVMYSVCCLSEENAVCKYKYYLLQKSCTIII